MVLGHIWGLVALGVDCSMQVGLELNTIQCVCWEEGGVHELANLGVGPEGPQADLASRHRPDGIHLQ